MKNIMIILNLLIETAVQTAIAPTEAGVIIGIFGAVGVASGAGKAC